jgi:sigma-E factor negative regulatory protein RseC
MIERGYIETVQGSTVTVKQERGISCFGCMNQECKQTQGIITAHNGTGKELQPGQLVETDIPASSVIVQALTALLPPFLGFAALFVVSGRVLPGLPESARAALGALGLFAVSFALYRYRRKSPPRRGPEIIRSLEA